MNTERVKIARRTMVLFFVVDTSGSMYGDKIGSVNDAIRETVPDLRDLSDNNPDAAIKVAVLQFDTDAKTQFLQEAAGSFAPVIILLSDGEPTDEYKIGLENIKKNNWFKHAIKIAIAIGNDADKNVLTEFTGNSEAVIEVHNRSALKAIIKFVSVTSSQVNSKSSGVDDASKQDKVISQVKDFVDTQNIDDTELDEFK